MLVFINKMCVQKYREEAACAALIRSTTQASVGLFELAGSKQCGEFLD